MTQDQKIIKNKIGLLKLAQALGSVSDACKVMGFSRDSFYRIGAASTAEIASRTSTRFTLIWRASSTPERRSRVHRPTGFANGSTRPSRTSSMPARFGASCIARSKRSRLTSTFGWRPTTPNARIRGSIATAKHPCRHSLKALSWRTINNWIGSNRHPNHRQHQFSRCVRQIES